MISSDELVGGNSSVATYKISWLCAASVATVVAVLSWKRQFMKADCDNFYVYGRRHLTSFKLLLTIRLKYIMLLKLPIILSGNSFNFYLLFQNYSQPFIVNLCNCAKRTTISYLS